MTVYQPHHESQYQAGASAITRSSGCTWTSGATGADAATAGKKDRTPDYIHSLVKRDEEQNPATPGWSLTDLDLAMKHLGVPFEVRSGRGWAAVVAAHDAGLYIVLQGDSDQFGNHTCSGSFDGLHAIGIRPGTTAGKWPIDDPICPSVRSETPGVLFNYARKLAMDVFFGVFTQKVPTVVKYPKRGWGADVGRAVQDAYSSVTVARKLRSLGVDPQKVVNQVDLQAGCAKRGIGYGSTVDVRDMKELMKPGTGPV
jgi:hypothetical protein